MERTVQMILEKETKGALRYQEVGPQGQPVLTMDDAVIGTLYIRKTAMAGSKPSPITVTIKG